MAGEVIEVDVGQCSRNYLGTAVKPEKAEQRIEAERSSTQLTITGADQSSMIRSAAIVNWPVSVKSLNIFRLKAGGPATSE